MRYKIKGLSDTHPVQEEFNTYMHDSEGFTKFPICPYCGFVHKNYYDFHLDNHTYTCDECNKRFVLNIDIDVSFCTRKLK